MDEATPLDAIDFDILTSGMAVPVLVSVNASIASKPKLRKSGSPARVATAMTGAGPAAERLAAALRTLCEVCERHAGVMSAMYGHQPRPLPGRPGRTTSFEFIEPFERLLRDGNVDGSLHSADPLPDATLTANMVCWTYLHMRQAHRWDAETTAGQVVPAAVAHLRRQ